MSSPVSCNNPNAQQDGVQQASAPFLRYAGGVHWQCTDAGSLIAILRAYGFIDLPTEHPRETARLWTQLHGRITVKHNGWLVARGQAMGLLETLRQAVQR